MRRKPISTRFAKAASRHWNRWRLRLRRTDRALWIVLSALASILAIFGFALYSIVDYHNDRRSLRCLALNVYYEARGESEAGQYAVAEVTMNRVASRHYPDTICGVVYQKNWDVLRKRYVSAFSWTEFDTVPSPKDEEWQRAVRVADDVFHGRYKPVLNGALFYHSTYIRPSWSRGKQPVARIGRHVFYN